MGDGLPSFAPQWLSKSGNTAALGAGTHHSSTSSREETKPGVSWRESGSRLGLGAGTDRDTASERDSKPAAANARRQGGNPSSYERSGYSSGSGDRVPGFRQQGTGRRLSDRELVEQTTSLKLRPASRAAADGAGFLDEVFHLGASPHNGERGFGGRQGQHRGGAHRKPVGSQRTGALHQRAPERDFANLGRQPAAPGPLPHSRLVGVATASPGSQPAASDQQWTSRLAEAPSPDPPPVSVSPVTPPPSTPATAAVVTVPDPPAKPATRMADAILQAQLTAAQEAEAAKAAKARLEQLALRQSKQLVPMIAAPKSKHAASSAAPALSPALTALKKPSGLEPLGKSSMSSLLLGARKEASEDASGSGKRTPPPGGSATAAAREATPGVQSPKVAAAGAIKPARDRLTFFSSLRRKTSGGELMGSGEHGHLVRQASSTASDGASAADPLSPKSNGNLEAHPLVNGTAKSVSAAGGLTPPGCDEPSDASAKNGSHNGVGVHAKAEPLAEMTPEEVAFMRSLGWEDAGDDAEGGLTEEEVAAFKAKYPNGTRCPKSALPRLSMPLNITSKRNAAASTKQAVRLPRSFHSELEFSDSDSE